MSQREQISVKITKQICQPKIAVWNFAYILSYVRRYTYKVTMCVSHCSFDKHVSTSLLRWSWVSNGEPCHAAPIVSVELIRPLNRGAARRVQALKQRGSLRRARIFAKDSAICYSYGLGMDG